MLNAGESQTLVEKGSPYSKVIVDVVGDVVVVVVAAVVVVLFILNK